MVVLVRCHDDSFAPALESHLNELITAGTISAYLCNGRWIEVPEKNDIAEGIVFSRRTLSRQATLQACA